MTPTRILQVAWFKDGEPLRLGNRITTTYDFGFASLDISYAHTEDTGVYTCVAKNELGEQSVQARLDVHG